MASERISPDGLKSLGYLSLSLLLLGAGLGSGGTLIGMKEAHPIIPTLGWVIKYASEFGFGASAVASAWHALLASYNPTTGRTKQL